MKKITILFLLTVSTISAFASIEELNVVKYNISQENTAVVSSRFGEAFVDETTDFSSFKNLTIHHVDLVYTAFRVADDFDQRALNEKRMRGLIKLLPQLKVKDPTWRAIRQTGAGSVQEARTYFHGFVLHFGEELSYEKQSKFFESFQPKPLIKKVDNEVETKFTIASGTAITIPANAVVDQTGNPITGEYDLVYREFRDQADIVFSGIPMTYTANGSEYNFSSVGMYEIRANQNGNELKLAKAIQLDFNTTEVKEDVGFFKMDDQSGQWEKIKPVTFKQERVSSNLEDKNGNLDHVPDQIIQNLNRAIVNQDPAWSLSDWNGHRYYKFSKSMFKKVYNHLDSMPDVVKDIVLIDKNKRHIKVDFDKTEKFEKEVNFSYTGLRVISWETGASDFNATLLGEGMGDAGHTYPTLVKGLNSPEFGVYNCDQIYRIGKAKRLSPTYVDSKSGKEIKDKHVTCVLDMTYNGSFSFQPNNITCNMKGENVILLFTEDKKTYVLDPEKFNQVKSETNPVFVMTDMTKELKSTEDLRTYLAR